MDPPNHVISRQDYTLLGRIALSAQRPIVVKFSRERSVGRSVCCLSSAGVHNLFEEVGH